MSRMAELHLMIQEDLDYGYLSFGAIAEKYEQYGITREDVELIHNEMVEQEIDCDDSDDGYAWDEAAADFEDSLEEIDDGQPNEDYGCYGD